MSTGTQRRGQVVEYNEYLAKQLQSARQRIKMVDVVSGVTVVGVGLVSYVLTVTVLDQMLTLSTGVRFGLLFVFVLVSLAYIALAIALPASRRVSSLYAAHAVEQSDPNTKNSLLNWLQLQDRKQEIPSQIMRAIERRAARDMARIPLQDAIEANHLIRASYVLAGVVVLFCAYTFLTTKPLGPSLKRVLFPLADVAPPTETKLVDIQPGNTEISEGEKLTLSAYASGEQPEVVTAYVKNANAGDEEWEPWTLEAPREEYGPWEVEIVNKHRSFDYYLKANDFVSATYRVDVTEAPRVTGYTVTYHYPAYTGQEVFSEEGGNIVALEGTRVEIEASTNLAAKTGVIEVTEYANKKQRKYPMTLSPGSSNRLVGEFVVDSDGDYFVDFEDVNGRRPPRKETRQIQAKKDESPILQFIEPAEPESKVPANGAARFRLLASDDYGLDMVAIRMRREGSDEPLREFIYGEDEEKLGLSKQFVEQLDLEPFGLLPGHVIEYWAEAKDNRRPAANTSDTRQQEQALGFEKRRIIITDPVKPQERQEQLNKTQIPPPDGEQSANQSEQQAEPSPEQGGDPPEQQRDPGDQTDEQFDEKKLSDKDRRKLEKLRELLKEREQEQDKQEQPQQKPDGNQQQNKQEQQEKKSEQQDDSSEQPKSKQEGQSQGGSQQDQQKQTGDGGAQKGDVPQKTTSQQSPQSGDPNKSDSSSGASDSGEDTNRDPANQDPGDSKSEQKRQEKGSAQGGKQEEKEATEKKDGSDSGASTSSQDDGSDPMGSDTKGSASAGGQKGDSQTDQKPSPKKQSSGSDSKEPKEDGEPQSERSDAGKEKTEQPEKGSSPDAQKKPEDARDSKMAGSNDGKSEAEPKGESKTGQNRQGPSDGGGEKKKGDGQQPTDKSSGGQGEQKESAKPTQKQGNKQVGDPNKSELPADQKGSNPEKSQNPAAGKSDAGDSPPMPDGSPKGEGAQKDQGAAKQQASDQTPRPDGEKDPKQKPSEGSRKEGKQDSAANKKGNQDGEANQGESATKGQSSTGSPSDQKGDNSNSSGQQKGQGQSEGQGESKQGQSQMGQGKGQGQGKGEEGQGQSKGQQGQGESKAEQQGEGKAESKSGQSKGSEKGESKGQGGNKDASKGSSGGQQQKPGSTRSSNPTAGGNPGGGGGGSDGITDNSGDDATASDRRQAANLNAALKDASEGRDIDHDLLKELGMTQQEFKEFADRVQQTAEPKDEPIDDPLKSKQRTDFGKSSKLRKSTTRGAGKTAQDQDRGMFGGRRGKVPEAYRELFRAYNLSIGRDRGAPAPAPASPE